LMVILMKTTSLRSRATSEVVMVVVSDDTEDGEDSEEDKLEFDSK
jgi:hypothetical protein